MVIGDIPATDIVDIMVALTTEDITVEGGTDDPTTEGITAEGGTDDLILEAFMAVHMAAATIAGVEDIGLESGSKEK